MECYHEFENFVRGNEDAVRDQLKNYVELFDLTKPIVELGCGRGEFLELLIESGATDVTGIDCNPDMLQICREKKLHVISQDAMEYLEKAVPESIGGIFTSHMVEHLLPETLQKLSSLAYKKLAFGGRFIAETLNPESFFGLSTFYMDHTHIFPVHPQRFKFTLLKAGFTEIEFIYKQFLPADFLQLDNIIPSAEPTPLESAYFNNTLKLQVLIDCFAKNYIYAIKATK